MKNNALRPNGEIVFLSVACETNNTSINSHNAQYMQVRTTQINLYYQTL